MSDSLRRPIVRHVAAWPGYIANVAGQVTVVTTIVRSAPVGVKVGPCARGQTVDGNATIVVDSRSADTSMELLRHQPYISALHPATVAGFDKQRANRQGGPMCCCFRMLKTGKGCTTEDTQPRRRLLMASTRKPARRKLGTLRNREVTRPVRERRRAAGLH
jgi:hypothetical protein